MASKQTEWKRIQFKTDAVDFSGALTSELECDGDSLILLKFKLKCGRVVRIRKADYGFVVEEPVITMDTLYLAKTTKGLTQKFKTEEEAKDALYGIEGEIEEIKVPREQPQLEADLPF